MAYELFGRIKDKAPDQWQTRFLAGDGGVHQRFVAEDPAMVEFRAQMAAVRAQ